MPPLASLRSAVSPKPVLGRACMVMASGMVIAGAPSARAGETAVRPDARRANRAAAILLIIGLVGCGPSDTERQAVAAQLSAERARLERQLAEEETRVRLLEEEMKREREQVPPQYGPGDFPTHPPEPRWAPTAEPGEERPPRDPRPPFHGR